VWGGEDQHGDFSPVPLQPRGQQKPGPAGRTLEGQAAQGVDRKLEEEGGGDASRMTVSLQFDHWAPVGFPPTAVTWVTPS
jgi:hypothetical protein